MTSLASNNIPQNLTAAPATTSITPPAHSATQSTTGQVQPSVAAATAASRTQAPPVSYAAAATKRTTSYTPPIVSSTVSPSPPVVSGAQGANARNTNASPVNGKTQVPPAVPTVTPTMPGAISNGTSGPTSHGRKSSLVSGGVGGMPNGNPHAQRQQQNNPNSIQFGFFGQNPAGPPPPGGAPVSSPNLAAPTGPNTRASPQITPSLPQPAVSGGPLNQGMRGQGITFGSLENNVPDRPDQRQMHNRPAPMAIPPVAPAQGPAHVRRESGSSHQPHPEMAQGLPSNRGMPSGGGRRGGPSYGQYPPQSQAYNHGNYNNNRNTPNQPRGGYANINNTPHYQNVQGQMGGYPSPQRAPPRSPHVPHSVPHGSLPTTPQLNTVQMASPSYPHANLYTPPQHVITPAPNPHSLRPASYPYPPPPEPMGWPAITEEGYINTWMGHDLTTMQQYNIPPAHHAYDPNLYHQHQYGQQMYQHPYAAAAPPPPSPNARYTAMNNLNAPTAYMYPMATPMSRNPSAAAPDINRPSSGVGMPYQAPMTPPATIPHQPTTPRSNSELFKRPDRGSKGIPIIDADTGQPRVFNKHEPTTPKPATPRPLVVSSGPVIVSSGPSPAPRHVTDAEKKRSDEEKRRQMALDVQRKKEEDEAREKEEARKKKEEEERFKREAEEAERRRVEEEERKQREEEERIKKEEERKRQEEAERKRKQEEAEAARLKAEEEAARIAKEKEEAERREKEEEAERKAKEEAERREKEEAERKAKAEAEAKAKAEAEAAEAVAAAAKAVAEAAELAKKKAAEEVAKQKAEEQAEARRVADTKKETQSVSTLLQPSSAKAAVEDVGRAAARPKGSKPQPLVLKTSNEPGPPSAALNSLRSARIIDDINSVKYPANILSPNPALNPSAAAGKFKYSKDFLLQFQTVFTEKPTEDWDNKIRETVGEPTDSARPMTARSSVGSGLGGRSSSRGLGGFTGQPPMGPMGAFGSASGLGGGKLGLPANMMTSAQRFEASNKAAGVTTTNPLQNFVSQFRPSPMSRTNSSTGLPQQAGMSPQSPRTGNRSQRGSKRGPGGATMERTESKQEREPKPIVTIPVSEVKPLVISGGGWKPRSVQAAAQTGAPPGAASAVATPIPTEDNRLSPEMVQRKVKAALNKMTPEKFDKISQQILDIASQSKFETDGRTLRQVIQLTFEKATDEAAWSSMYAKFCKAMLDNMDPAIKDESIKDAKTGQVASGGSLFRKYLLNRCQEEFERGWKVNLPPKPEGESEEAVMLSDEYYIAAAAKRRGLGLIQFIGELFKLNMLTERIMHECVKKLVFYEGTPEEAEVESLVKLLKTIGSRLDSTDKSKPALDSYFHRIKGMIELPDLPSRLKFMLMDIVDLRSKRWETNERDKGPKTIAEIREDAAKAAAEKEAQSRASAQQRGGGRPMGGRGGDGRSFSHGGYGAQQDYQQRQQVNSSLTQDELRRLGSRSSKGPTSGIQSFGPPSMFARNHSNPKKMGPPAFGRGDDSTPSRTGTPQPGQTVSKNSFHVLGDMGSHGNDGDNNDSVSPSPSAPTSPPSLKATLALRPSFLGKGDSK